MELPVLKIDGSESGKKVVLDEKVFGVEPNDHAIYLVGGGRVFGPKPRLYRFKLNKKLKSLARCSALTYKAQENAIVLVEPFAMEAPKTKELMRILDALKAGQRKVLVVLPENSNNIFLSSRNLPEVKVITVDEINTYTVMNANSMVLVDGVQDVLAARVNR